jgi:hypothetical protein
LTIVIRPVPLIFLLLAIVAWLYKPPVASKPQVIVRSNGGVASALNRATNNLFQEKLHEQFDNLE